MKRTPAPSNDLPTLQAVLAALDDSDCRRILRETAEPTTASELVEACAIASTTVYRKLDRLSRASLVRELETLDPDGGRVTRYERDFEDVRISMDASGDLSVTIERPSRETDERQQAVHHAP